MPLRCLLEIMCKYFVTNMYSKFAGFANYYFCRCRYRCVVLLWNHSMPTASHSLVGSEYVGYHGSRNTVHRWLCFSWNDRKSANSKTLFGKNDKIGNQRNVYCWICLHIWLDVCGLR